MGATTTSVVGGSLILLFAGVLAVWFMTRMDPKRSYVRVEIKLIPPTISFTVSDTQREIESHRLPRDESRRRAPL
jgi:hypothetical protein